MELQYLPAPYPPNEDERVAVAQRYVKLWTIQDSDDITDLVEQAARRFDVSHIVVSFFTKEREIRLAESFQSDGSRELENPRQSSLLAHALYSHDVLVVLNTREVSSFSST